MFAGLKSLCEEDLDAIAGGLGDCTVAVIEPESMVFRDRHATMAREICA